MKLSFKEIRNIVLGAIALIGSIVTIWVAIIQGDLWQKEPSLSVETITNSDIISVSENLDDLKVIYKDKSLLDSNEGLKLLEFKIANNGDVNIKKNDFDESDPFGIRITNGIITTNPTISNHSSEYLKNNVKATVDSLQREIRFNQVILDKNESFIVKLLALHNRDEEINYETIGKVSGIESISISVKRNATEDKGVKSAYQGNFWIQLIRMLIYPILFLILLIILSFLYSWLSAGSDKIKRRRLIDKFKRIEDYATIDDVILNRFKTEGYFNLAEVLRLLNHPKRMQSIYIEAKKLFENSQERTESENESDSDTIPNLDNINFEVEEDIINSVTSWIKKTQHFEIVLGMIDDGYISVEENDKLIINEKLKETLKRFMTFLRNEKYKESMPSIEGGNVVLPVPLIKR